MIDRIPVQRLHHITVVVRDLKAMARNYAEVYGIERWRVVRHTEERLTDARAFGIPMPQSYVTATGANDHGVIFRLVQPAGGFSTFQEFLITRGLGIHSFCTAVLDEAACDELTRWLASEGVTVGQSATVDGAARHVFFDMRPVLANFFVEVIVPLRRDWQTAIRADEEWDLAGQIARPPEADSTQAIERIGHFGIVVDSLMARLPRFARLFGVPRWRSSHLSIRDGLLEELVYRGQRVDHAFLLALTPVADFGLELIQPTKGPSHYRVDYLEPLGEGIHHMLLHPRMEAARWPAFRDWMGSMDAPVILTGTVHGGATFSYTDTRAKLGGYVYETICPGAHPPGPPTAQGGPPSRFEFDFSSLLPRS